MLRVVLELLDKPEIQAPLALLVKLAPLVPPARRAILDRRVLLVTSVQLVLQVPLVRPAKLVPQEIRDPPAPLDRQVPQVKPG